MFRYLFTLLFIGLFLLFSLPYQGIEWILGKYNREASDLRQLRVVQAVFKTILKLCGTKVIVIGEENVPTNKPVLYVANHRSLFDVPITYSRCPGRTGYVSKDVMGKIPGLNLWMKRLYCLFLNRDDIKEGLKMILAGIENIKSGVSMCIFPEGTRNKGDDLMLPFKEGSFKMAEKTGCPIIPMALTNTSAIFEDHFPCVKPTTVILEYGTPIYPNELEKEDRKKLGAYCQQAIEEMLKKNANHEALRP